MCLFGDVYFAGFPVTLHPGGDVDSLSEHQVAGYTFPYHAGYHWATVQPYTDLERTDGKRTRYILL